jgi:RNA polymerase sigma-70 factor (ECF subfamily)
MVAALKSPDPLETFSALYGDHAKAAYGFALRLTENRALAEDAVQEAMLRAWRAIPSLQEGNIRSWIFRIVSRECLRLQKTAQQEGKRVAAANHLRDLQADSFDNPEGETLHSRLNDVLAKLPNEDRHLLSLRFEKGLSQRKIGAAMSVHPHTISHRLQRTLRHLRGELAIH